MSHLNAKQQAVGSCILPPGSYKIFSVARDLSGLVRADKVDAPIFITPGKGHFSGKEVWILEPGHEAGSFIFQNVGIRRAPIGTGPEKHLFLVDSEDDAASFIIQPDAHGTFIIKLANEDKLWTLEDGHGDYTQLTLRSAKDTWRQKFKVVPVKD
ncbi:hypothetical protein BKA62DRAFT_705122 [Auriculariales sp. MPI-PUGE-AT-0066]|nr:hypothetical protein BKA62DRAFT_705122 [Auriculariales sp. MPI-PUGE-AT-0066]